MATTVPLKLIKAMHIARYNSHIPKRPGLALSHFSVSLLWFSLCLRLYASESRSLRGNERPLSRFVCLAEHAVSPSFKRGSVSPFFQPGSVSPFFQLGLVSPFFEPGKQKLSLLWLTLAPTSDKGSHLSLFLL